MDALLALMVFFRFRPRSVVGFDYLGSGVGFVGFVVLFVFASDKRIIKHVKICFKIYM